MLQGRLWYIDDRKWEINILRAKTPWRFLIVLYLELKHRQAIICALAAGKISTRSEMVGSQRSWTREPWNSANNRPVPKLVHHRTENVTETWTKIQIRMGRSMGWRRFKLYSFERMKGCVPGTNYHYILWYFRWRLNTGTPRTTVLWHQDTFQLAAKWCLTRSGVEPGDTHNDNNRLPRVSLTIQ